MAERATKQKPKQRREVKEESEQSSRKTVAPKQTLTDHIDELLDEIDEALADNGITNSIEADQWVKSFVQQGGE